MRSSTVSLHGKVTKLEKTHRFAGFRVLKGPDIPSTLIELGFLSNVTDERLLLSAGVPRDGSQLRRQGH